MRAEAIFTGTELLLGQTLNTNSQLLQQELAELGIDLYFQITVGDNLDRCVEALNQAAVRSDLIIMGGGLGPTEDDLSRESLAKTLGLELIRNEQAFQIMSRYFRERGIPISAKNEKQALIPSGGEVLDNPIGTAPGVWLATQMNGQNKIFALLPGPPREFKKMLHEVLRPRLEQVLGDKHPKLAYKVLRFCGIGESTLDEA
ncbi:MAG: molybdopterin-binding protein, partial [Clostridia bacterium]|nr:molybdopterin-binding protein [Clostridia bacterium]